MDTRGTLTTPIRIHGVSYYQMWQFKIYFYNKPFLHKITSIIQEQIFEFLQLSLQRLHAWSPCLGICKHKNWCKIVVFLSLFSLVFDILPKVSSDFNVYNVSITQKKPFDTIRLEKSLLLLIRSRYLNTVSWPQTHHALHINISSLHIVCTVMRKIFLKSPTQKKKVAIYVCNCYTWSPCSLALDIVKPQAS